MTKKEAAQALGISLRTLERRMADGSVKFSRGDEQFAEVSFTLADLGLPEPKTAFLPAHCSGDHPPVDPVVPVETAPSDDFASMTHEELMRERARLCQPDCPGGPITNSPAVGSGTMPSPASMELIRQIDVEIQHNRHHEPQHHEPVPQSQYTTYMGYRDLELAKHNSRVSNLNADAFKAWKHQPKEENL